MNKWALIQNLIFGRRKCFHIERLEGGGKKGRMIGIYHNRFIRRCESYARLFMGALVSRVDGGDRSRASRGSLFDQGVHRGRNSEDDEHANKKSNASGMKTDTILKEKYFSISVYLNFLKCPFFTNCIFVVLNIFQVC